MKSKRIQSGRRFLALDIDDIPGAKPRATKATKNFSHYEKQLSGDLSPFMDSIEKQKNLFGNHQTIFGSGEQKQNYQEAKSGKRHYIKHWDSEIGEDNVIKRRDDQRNSKIETFDYPRNLVTDDIPGATAGSLKNKALKNHNLAGTLRQSASSTKIRPTPIVQRNQSQDESLDRYSFRIPPKKEEKYDYSHSFNPALGRISSLQNLLKRQRLSEIVSQNGFEEKPPQQNNDSRYQNYPIPYDFKYAIDEFPVHAGLPSKPSHMLGKRHSSVPHLRNREVILPDYEGSLQRDVWENSNQRESPPKYERYEEFPPLNQYLVQNHNDKPKVEHLMATPEPTKNSLKKISVFNIISNQANTKEIPAQAKLPHRYGIEWGPGGQPRRGLQNIASQRVQQNFEHIDALDRLRLPDLHQNQNHFYRDSPDYQNPTRQRSREPNNYHYQHHNY